MNTLLNISCWLEKIIGQLQIREHKNLLFSNLLKKGKYSIASFFCFLALTSFSQTIEVKTQDYNETNGLSTYANYIHKDSRDIIWIGTQFGLYRFDGQEFAHFDKKDGLPFRQIMKIFEDSEGWFWLHKNCFSKPNCQKDLAFFHPLTKEVLTFEQRFGDKVSFTASQVQRIAQDSTNIYFTADKNLVIWSKEGGIKEIPIQGTNKTPSLWTKVNENRLGAIESIRIKNGQNFSRNTQYLTIDTNGQIHQQLQIPLNIQSLHSNGFIADRFELEGFRVKNLEIGKAPDGSITIDTLDFSLPCCPKNEDYADFDQNLFTDQHGQLFHTDLGLIKNIEKIYPTGLNIRAGHTLIKKVWIKEKDSPNYFQHFRGNPRHHYFDHETKTAWLALPEGIKTIEYKPQIINHLQAPNSQKQLARSAIAISEHELILSIGEERFFYKTRTNELNPLPIFSNHDYIQPQLCGNVGLEKSTFWFFSRSQKNSNFLLFKLNTQNLAFTVYTPLSLNPNIHLRQMIQMDNRFLIGSRNGLRWYHLSNHTLEAFQQYNEFETLKTAKIHFLKSLDGEHYWIGTNMGLYLFSKKEGVLARYGDMEEGEFYLPTKEFYHMSEAKEGGYWLATMQGLVRWNPSAQPPDPLKGEHSPANSENSNKTPNRARGSSPFRGSGGCEGNCWQHFSTETTLSTNEILAAYEDDFGFVWLPTPHGLIQFQISTGLSKTYREGEGLSSGSFQEYAHAQMPDGTLVLGSYKGFNVLHPKDFKHVQFNPEVPLSILDFEQYKANTDSIEYRLKDVVEKGEIILEPGDKFFNIRVALADYRNADKHRFTYKIEGYQAEWQEDKSNLIRISGLPYGKYILKIKGRLPDGQLAEPGLSIPIKVLKPFYLKTSFIIAAFSFFLFGTFIFYKWRMRRLQTRQKELEVAIADATEMIELDKQIIEGQAEELRNLDKLKSRFFANVSHELRTPLTLMLGPINSLKKGTLPQEKSNRLLDFIHKNSNHLLKLVNEILDLSKLETDRLEVKETAINFYEFLQPLIAQFSSFGDSQSVQLLFEYQPEKSLNILLDTNKFEKIAHNYLANALKFTPTDGRVDLIIEDLGERLLLKVKDNGKGIHPQDLPHIFDRFYQSKQADAPAQGGTGIGLSLCKELAELLEGKVWAASELGLGSTFYFEFPKRVSELSVEGLEELPAQPPNPLKGEPLPISQDSKLIEVGGSPPEYSGLGGSTGEIPNPQPATVNRQPSTVLIVEDNLQLREYMTVLLEDQYHVLTAENGKVAWEMLTATQPPNPEYSGEPQPSNSKAGGNSPFRGSGGWDGKNPQLIISDIMMPVMDGFQFLEKVKAKPAFQRIPFIMLTARADVRVKLRALRIGVDDYLIKPFVEEELLARIENLLKHSQWRQQYQQEQLEEAHILNENDPNTEKVPASKSISEEDQIWLEKLESTLLGKHGQVNYSIEQLAQDLAASRWTLYRRTKELTGLTPTQYLQELRLNQAYLHLEQQKATSVKATAYQVGFKDVKYFSQQFKKRFGRLPSAYLK